MARPEFVNPDFVDDAEASAIHDRMMQNLPVGISNIEGDFAHDFTMPTAIEISQLVQFDLARVLMIAFPEYAWDEYLDMHGTQIGVERYLAEKAHGTVTVEGDVGVSIDAGTIFCVPATNENEAIEYSTDQDVVLGESAVQIPVTAVEGGINGNVASGMISIMEEPIEGITSVINEQPMTGGTDDEDDEAYYERIHTAYQSSLYYVGTDSDYIRWAKEISGIGDCIVIDTWNGPGTVKLILVDSTGAPASSDLVTKVYNHIVSPGDRSKRLLPTACAALTVVPADEKVVDYSCTGIILEDGYTINTVTDSFKAAVLLLYSDAKKVGVLRYNAVRSILINIDGVVDYAEFLVDEDVENVVIQANEYVVTGDVLFTSEDTLPDPEDAGEGGDDDES